MPPYSPRPGDEDLPYDYRGLDNLPPPIRVLIASGAEPVRNTLTRTLHAIPTRMALVGSAASAQEAVRAARRLRPDVVVVDVSIARLDVGLLTLVPSLCEAGRCRVVLLASRSDQAGIPAAMQAGAAAVAWKAESPVALIGAINTAVFGHPRVVRPLGEPAPAARRGPGRARSLD